MTFEATPLNILLLVLVVAGIWALAELALTIRKARVTIDQVAHTANDTVEQVQPILGKVDGLMDDIQPAVKEVQPLMDKVGVTLDEATVSVTRVNDILGDVSSATGAATAVTDSFKGAADAAASTVAGVVSRITRAASPEPARLADAQEAAQAAQSEPDTNPGYVVYGSQPTADDAE